MKKSIVIATLTAASLGLAACGGETTTENTTVTTNEVVLDEAPLDTNLTAVDTLNGTEALGNVADPGLTAIETTTTTNTVSNAN